VTHHHSIIEHIPSTLRGLLDIASVGVVLGTLFSYLPQIAALFTIVWTTIRIWESRTVQNYFGREKDDHDRNTHRHEPD